MYKLLLSSRYLRTRFIALASIVSVMLGVATMIVVNSVMSGFSAQMRDRIHGILADLMVETLSTDGEGLPEELIEEIHRIAGDYIAAVTPTVEIYGMMSFHFYGQEIYRPVTLIGIDPEGKDLVSPLRQYLRSRQERQDGPRTRPAEVALSQPLDWNLSPSARAIRNEWVQLEAMRARYSEQYVSPASGETTDFDAEFEPATDFAANPFDQAPASAQDHEPIDPSQPQPARLYVGEGLVSYPDPAPDGTARQAYMVAPGQDVSITTIKQGKPEPVSFKATVVDLFKSGMAEYDSSLVFCSLEHLQKFRGMMAPPSRQPLHAGSTQAEMDAWEAAGRDWQANRNLDWRDGKFTTLQIRLKDYRDAPVVTDLLRRGLDFRRFQVKTWEQKQGPLLEAVEIESAILNVLLFLIITVAGFGILAIFYMIVVEKTRDIGILKALGASSRGVMSIFLGYGLALGVVGSGVGVALGLVFVRYINEVESFVSWVLGHKVFDEQIYYFREIPTAVHPMMVVWVALGAVLIAVLASVLPARRAAALHPVQALRYE
ncbi:MAG: ABC transporter permease [Planctomyces sp.]|nr:ABC transporter permease [Planctomyces sp.]